MIFKFFVKMTSEIEFIIANKPCASNKPLQSSVESVK